MSKLSTAKANLIATLFAANKTDAEVAKEAKVAMSTVKVERMAYQNAQVAAFAAKKAEEAKPRVVTLGLASHYQALTAPTCLTPKAEPAKVVNKMAQMAADAKAKKEAATPAATVTTEAPKTEAPKQPELTPEQQAQMDQMLALQAQLMESGAITKPAPVVKATREKQSPKDLTKRDVVAVVCKSLNQAYVCTSIKYSATTKGAELLKKDMLKRASLVDMANAEDFEFIVVKSQVEHTEAQTSKLRAHLSYEKQGYKMMSTKGRGQEVKDILAKLQAESTTTEATATPVTVAA